MATARVVITASNKMSPALLQAKKSMMQFEQSVAKVGNTLKTALGATSAFVALKKLNDFMKSAFEDFNEADRKYKQLQLTLGNSEAFDKVSQNLKRLSRLTLSTKDQVEGMVSQIAALGKSPEEVNRLSDAAVYLSNITKKDLQTSLNTLLGTYNGTTKEIAKLIPEIKDLTKEQLKNGAAVDLVTEKFKTLSEEMAAGDSTQALKNIKDSLGDIKQAIGGVINKNLSGFLTDLDKKLSEMSGNIENVINYVGTAITQLPAIASLAFDTVIQMVERLFDFNTLKSLFSTIGKALLNSLATAVENISLLINGVVEFVLLEIQYIGNSLYSELVKSIYDFFDSSDSMFKDSWLGKLLDWATKASGYLKIGIGATLAGPEIVSGKKMNALSSYLITSGYQEASGKSLEDRTSAIKAAADEAIKNLGKTIKSMFSNLGESNSALFSAAGTFLSDNFSDIIENFKNAVDAIVLPKMGSGSGTSTGGTSGGGKDEPPETTSSNFLQNFATDLGEKLDGVFGSSSGQWTSGITAAISSFTSSLGEAGTFITTLASNMATMGPLLGSIVSVLNSVIQGLGEVISGPINELLTLILEPFKEIGRTLGKVLAPIIQTISGVLAPILSVIGNVLKALEPVLKVFAKVVVTITGTIQYVIQVLQHWVATIMNWLAGLNIFGWHPFGGLAMNDPGSPGRFSDFIQNKWASVDAAFAASNTTAATATGVAVASAGYQGATHITINIYQQAPVVGDGGMRDFARLIRQEFDNLSYYGVTA